MHTAFAINIRRFEKRVHSQKKRYKSCHWGCTLSKDTLLYLKAAYLGYISAPKMYILAPKMHILAPKMHILAPEMDILAHEMDKSLPFEKVQPQ